MRLSKRQAALPAILLAALIVFAPAAFADDAAPEAEGVAQAIQGQAAGNASGNPEPPVQVPQDPPAPAEAPEAMPAPAAEPEPADVPEPNPVPAAGDPSLTPDPSPTPEPEPAPASAPGESATANDAGAPQGQPGAELIAPAAQPGEDVSPEPDAAPALPTQEGPAAQPELEGEPSGAAAKPVAAPVKASASIAPADAADAAKLVAAPAKAPAATSSAAAKAEAGKASYTRGATSMPVASTSKWTLRNAMLQVLSGSAVEVKGSTVTAVKVGSSILRVVDLLGQKVADLSVRVYAFKGAYVLRSAKDTGLVLNVKASSKANKANVQIYKKDGSRAQEFRFVRSGGHYFLVNSNSGLAVDVRDGSRADRANVWQYRRNGTAAQKWRIEVDANNRLTLVNAKSGKALDMAGGKAASGANVWQYRSNKSDAQKWQLGLAKARYTLGATRMPVASVAKWKAENAWLKLDAGSAVEVKGATVTAVRAGAATIGVYSAADKLLATRKVTVHALDGTYMLDSALGKLSLGMSGKDARLASRAVAKGSIVRFERKGDAYVVVNPSSKLALDVANGSTANRANVRFYKKNGTAAQKWRIEVDAKNRLTFVNSKSGKALDVASGKAAKGANVWQYRPNGTTAQKFGLVQLKWVKDYKSAWSEKTITVVDRAAWTERVPVTKTGEISFFATNLSDPLYSPCYLQNSGSKVLYTKVKLYNGMLDARDVKKHNLPEFLAYQADPYHSHYGWYDLINDWGIDTYYPDFDVQSFAANFAKDNTKYTQAEIEAQLAVIRDDVADIMTRARQKHYERFGGDPKATGFNWGFFEYFDIWEGEYKTVKHAAETHTEKKWVNEKVAAGGHWARE